MSESCAKELAAVAEEAAERVVEKMLLRFGVDYANPLEMQKDFAFIRSWRDSTNLMRRRGLITIVTILITGFFGIIYAAFVHKP